MLPIMFINGLPRLVSAMRRASERLLLATQIRKSMRDKKEGSIPIVPVFLVTASQKEPVMLALTDLQVRELFESPLVRGGAELAQILNAAQVVTGGQS